MQVHKLGVILSKRDLNFEIEGVLNPAVIFANDFIHMFYRAVAADNYSSIGYCCFDTNLQIKSQSNIPILVPESDFEHHGIEDPRIVKIEDIYYLTYTAYDGINALGALASSNNLIDFEKRGIIVPQISYFEFSRQTIKNKNLGDKYHRYNFHDGLEYIDNKKVLVWDKNIVLFPRKINGQFVFLHRIRPDIQIGFVDEIENLNGSYWEEYMNQFDQHIVLKPKYPHESSYIGAGCPPIETKQGWLLIYHGVQDSINGYIYSACAALLDIKNPSIVLSRLKIPLFTPQSDYETIGIVNNVCFPTGTYLDENDLYIFYGAADERIATVSVNIESLIAELLENKE